MPNHLMEGGDAEVWQFLCSYTVSYAKSLFKSHLRILCFPHWFLDLPHV